MNGNKVNKNHIFIHVPKNAGTSVVHALNIPCYSGRKDPRLKELGFFDRNRYPPFYKFNQEGPVCFGHSRISDLYKYGFLTRDFWESSFKWAFVRNPWDRFVSLFTYRREQIHDHISNRRAKNYSEDNFEKFIMETMSQFPFAPLGPYSRIWRRKHIFMSFNPQVRWLTDDSGNWVTDVIGQVENLGKDFAHICGILGYGKISLPHKNPSGRRDYHEYYNKETRDRIGEIYKEDIDAFGYSF